MHTRKNAIIEMRQLLMNQLLSLRVPVCSGTGSKLEDDPPRASIQSYRARGLSLALPDGQTYNWLTLGAS